MTDHDIIVGRQGSEIVVVILAVLPLQQHGQAAGPMLEAALELTVLDKTTQVRAECLDNRASGRQRLALHGGPFCSPGQ